MLLFNTIYDFFQLISDIEALCQGQTVGNIHTLVCVTYIVDIRCFNSGDIHSVHRLDKVDRFAVPVIIKKLL